MNSTQSFIFPLFILFLLSAAQAETINEKAEVINDQTEWRLRDKANQQTLDKRLKLSKPSIQLPKTEALSSPKQEAICFVINTIEVEGLLSNWVKQQGKIYIEQCVGMESIQAYIRLINKNLLAQGYITSRAILPEQNLASKVLIIKILEGTIENIEFPSNYRFVWPHALPLKIGNVLNLRDMEQAVDQLNRLQSQSIEFKIKPGLESNGSILVAEVKESKRWYISASVDNSGSISTGEYPVSINGGLDNAFFIQDSLSYSLSLAKNVTTGQSRSGSITWEIPFGYWSVKLNKSYSDYQQETEGSVTNFELTGTSNDNKLSIDYVLSRDNKTKTSLFGYLKTRERHSFIDGTEIEVQALNLTEVELGSTYRHYIGRSVLDLSLSVHQGFELLGSDSVDNEEDNRDVEQPNYRFYSLTTSFTTPFSVYKNNLNYSGQLFAQYTDLAIYSLDWFSIGGRYTVRGFDSGQGLSSDKGWRLKNDISLPFQVSQIAATTYIGFDIGQVFGEGIEDENESENTLAGLTLGIKGQLLGINYDVFASTPFLAYGPYASASDYTISASLSTQF